MKSAGKSATKYAKSLLKLNTEYEYETKGKDRYGRYICVVKNGDTTFNEQMVTGGYASIFRFYMNKEELTYYEDLLQTAKRNKVGMWNNRFEVMECLDEAREL
ncbi:MAG: thermonuclease family protein [Flavobacteriales bacterium]|nr:thermonuclease family protein [Flavobacteriales bacterium]